jgi:DNA-binding response OmpR family regulator
MRNLDVEMISQKGIKSPVLFLTAKTSSEDELTGLKMGAVDYIKKPFKKETLLLKVKRILQ